jgi:flagellar motor component MotA
VWFSTLLIVLIGMIAMLKHLEDRAMLGPNMALMFISTLYATALQIVVFIPFSFKLNRKRDEIAEI